MSVDEKAWGWHLTRKHTWPLIPTSTLRQRKGRAPPTHPHRTWPHPGPLQGQQGQGGPPGWGGGVFDDDTYMTPQGCQDFVALGLKIDQENLKTPRPFVQIFKIQDSRWTQLTLRIQWPFPLPLSKGENTNSKFRWKKTVYQADRRTHFHPQVVFVSFPSVGVHPKIQRIPPFHFQETKFQSWENDVRGTTDDLPRLETQWDHEMFSRWSTLYDLKMISTIFYICCFFNERKVARNKEAHCANYFSKGLWGLMDLRERKWNRKLVGT